MFISGRGIEPRIVHRLNPPGQVRILIGVHETPFVVYMHDHALREAGPNAMHFRFRSRNTSKRSYMPHIQAVW